MLVQCQLRHLFLTLCKNSIMGTKISGVEVMTRLAIELKIPLHERGGKARLARTMGISGDLLHQWWRRDYVGLDEVIQTCIAHDLDLNTVIAGRPVEKTAQLEFLSADTPSDPIHTLDQIDELTRALRESLLNEKGLE